VGQYVWRPNRRPKGAPSKTVDAELDYRLIQRATDLLPLKNTIGAALRAAIEEAREGGKLVYVETESQIKRLRQKARRLGLLTG
jgi:hypothetical protein